MTSRSSVVELYGAAFPAWIFPALVGLALTLVLREAFILTGLSRNLPLPARLPARIETQIEAALQRRPDL